MLEETLLFLIKVAVVMLLLLWLLISFHVLYRKYRQKRTRKIEIAFADIISRHLYGDLSVKLSLIQIQEAMHEMGISRKRTGNVQFMIELMIRTQRLLLGKSHEKIRDLYNKIPPYRASYRKTEDRRWYKVALGIREIYEMNQPQYTRHISRFRDDPNPYVRREAQIALVVFLGWESLRFVPYLTREIDLWQQIKIVEKLYHLHRKPRVEYLRKIYKLDHKYGEELIMRIIRKFRLSEELDYIISRLSSQSAKVRETAIECLSSFELNASQLEKVKDFFPTLNYLNEQRQVLKLIATSSGKDNTGFLRSIQGQESSDLLQLEVAEILSNIEYEGLAHKSHPSNSEENLLIPIKS